MRWQFIYIGVLFLCLCALSCQKNDYYPKPTGYARLYMPEKGFQQYDHNNCPFTFQYPTYGEIIQDKKFFGEEVSCWFDINLEQLNGKIHFSYKAIGKDITLENAVNDAHELTYKHTKKADYIDESTIKNQYGAEGLLFEVGGNAASSMQFYLTDWQYHYIRGALYFKTQPNIDSIRPVIDFVKEDMLVLFNSFQWSVDNN